MFNRLGSFFNKKIHGTDWRDQEKEFWEQMVVKTPRY
jgi:hypothetical protein